MVILKPAAQNTAIPSPRVSNKNSFVSGMNQQLALGQVPPQQQTQQQPAVPLSQMQQGSGPGGLSGISANSGYRNMPEIGNGLGMLGQGNQNPSPRLANNSFVSSFNQQASQQSHFQQMLSPLQPSMQSGGAFRAVVEPYNYKQKGMDDMGRQGSQEDSEVRAIAENIKKNQNFEANLKLLNQKIELNPSKI